MKRYQDINVYDAALKRIEDAILHFEDFYVSFSGGKDSGVLINLVIEVARKLDRLPVKTVFSDLEVIFSETERYTRHIMELPEVEPYWLCIEELDDNGSSVYERYFKIWDHTKKDIWVRPMPDMDYVINLDNCPEGFRKYLKLDNIEHWSLENFGEYLCDLSGASKICNFIGMRSLESYGRHMAVATQKHRTKLNNHTYLTKDEARRTWTCLPIYDWDYTDIWHYYAITGKDYNRVYDSMYRMGLAHSQMRTCSAFGEEQKKSLWMWQVIEPETWDKMVRRVAGANFGKIYNHTNINRGKVVKPKNITWKEYLDILLAQLPPLTRSNFEEKFKITFRYHKVMYEEKEGISPDIYIQDSRKKAREVSTETGLSIKYFISYETLCAAIIKRDFVFKQYGFGYSNKMSERIKNMQERWDSKL
jgi:predicted phosphoadenosine phosphosulfate sulfurtransferase